MAKGIFTLLVAILLQLTLIAVELGVLLGKL